jgi:hypothetical protein
MGNGFQKELLVGDNPFHGISHLSQEHARSRYVNAASAAERADLVSNCFRNGANGFMFSVSDITLSILRALQQRREIDAIKLYAIVPYAFEYVRVATQTGTPGLAKRFAKQITKSRDVGTIFKGLKALVRTNPKGILATYLSYEISRIKSSAGKKTNLASVFLHEVITDMCLALDFRWLFDSHIALLSEIGVVPGFHTRNFPYLVEKFNEWSIDLDEILITTPFNEAGFQMNPSKIECEQALKKFNKANVIAISIFASGYLKPKDAMKYISSLPNIRGVAVGVSNERQAIETFTLLRQIL